MVKRCVEMGWVNPGVVDIFTVIEIVRENLLKSSLIGGCKVAEGLKLQTRGIGCGWL